MYAIVQEGGRQLKVSEGQELLIDYRTATSGEKLQFDRVLAYNDGQTLQIGKPTLDKATVEAEVLGVKLGPKLVVQKFRRRKNSRRRTGHRQMHTLVKINKISVA
ncbi:MAG: 50S ribosomal protein L21 [Pirellulales bacterium]|nr:50S ribosomal protein L21 [Planctomycetales bacterium]